MKSERSFTLFKHTDQRTRHRIAIGTYFFLSGLCLASWASRIPTIKEILLINDAQLGTLLFVMPVSQFAGLPISGWLSSRFETRWPIVVSVILHALSLVFIGVSETIPTLVVSMFIFAFFMRILNIAMNAQALTLQQQYKKRINGAFHGLWSIGGIGGVALTSLMIALKVDMRSHFLGIGVLVILAGIIAFRYLIVGDRAASGHKLNLHKPDQQTLLLGILVLLAAICEGGMFDWSGVYFKEVVQVEIFTAGYLIFMTCMALSRFISDFIIKHIGMKSMYLFSAVLMTSGLMIAVLFPTFHVVMAGFSMVGIGTASIFPMTFFLAGTSKKFTPSIALSIVVTYAMVGVLFGPVIIGYIAHSLHLRASFVFIAIISLAIVPTSRLYFSKFRDHGEPSEIQHDDQNISR